MLTCESWEMLPGGNHFISNYGNVLELFREEELINKNIVVNEDGFKTIKYFYNGNQILYYLHELVAEKFVKKPTIDSDCKEIIHKDGNKLNNHFSNIKWTSDIIRKFEEDEINKIMNNVNNPRITTEIKIKKEIIEVEKEKWKKIKKSLGYYLSNFGNFKRIKDGKTIMIRGWINKYGYRMVSYFDEDNKRHRLLLHKLVAEYFIEKPNEENNIVNHKDGNKANVHYKNLEWITSSKK